MITSEFVAKETTADIQAAMAHLIRVYNNKGIWVIPAVGYGQLNPVWGTLGLMDLNTTAVAKHAQEIDCKIWVIKECFCAFWSTFPFQYIPGRIIIKVISFSIMWLNALPSKNGVYSVYSPRAIMANTLFD